MRNIITKEKILKYFTITKEALDMAIDKFDQDRLKDAEDFFDMASRYYSDAQHFYSKEDYINAFAAVNYAHGWLDSGVRLHVFDVDDDRLFTVC